MQGKESKEEERADAFHFAQELDSALNGCATQIVVVNTKEPEHFIRIFKGKLIILTVCNNLLLTVLKNYYYQKISFNPFQTKNYYIKKLQ